MTDERAEIESLVDNWAGAVRKKDMAGILRAHASDILMFDLPPPLQSRGIEAYEKTWNLFFSWSRQPIVFDVLERHITAGGDVAYVSAIMRCAGGRNDGEESELQFRLTMGLRKTEGRWVITHEHHSIPAR